MTNEAILLEKAYNDLAALTKETESQATKLDLLAKELHNKIVENEKLASQLQQASDKLLSQNQEKEKRAQELVSANERLKIQNQEKQNRADELATANIELEFQNQEKQKRADELATANIELGFQNQEKQKRADELAVANIELEFQSKEKEKRANELLLAYKEIESFTYISSHDLQEPLRKIQSFSGRIFTEEYDNLSAMGKYYVERTKLSALHMQTLINDLLAYSRTSTTQRKYVQCNLKTIVDEAMAMLKEDLTEKQAVIEVGNVENITIIPFQFRQLLQNIISNALKFCPPSRTPKIKIDSELILFDATQPDKMVLNTNYHHITITDNGIGFEKQYKDKIFEIFQRLHDRKEYDGTGIGLSIARKIVENHGGKITAESEINEGATFHIYLPELQ
ncbi:MAG: ATP-binding protein [Flavobacterium sp.]